MKTKLLKNKGYYRLMVDDKKINEEYDCTQKDAICLAKLESWMDTGLWSLYDMRLAQHVQPNHYFEGFTDEIYIPKSEEDKERLLGKLKIYRLHENKVIWPSFEGIVAFGDKTGQTDLPSYLKNKLTGFWSFKAGMEKLNEIRTFWESQTEADLTIKIDNPHRQINHHDHFFAEYIISENLQGNEKNKKKIKP